MKPDATMLLTVAAAIVLAKAGGRHTTEPQLGRNVAIWSIDDLYSKSTGVYIARLSSQKSYIGSRPNGLDATSIHGSVLEFEILTTLKGEQSKEVEVVNFWCDDSTMFINGPNLAYFDPADEKSSTDFLIFLTHFDGKLSSPVSGFLDSRESFRKMSKVQKDKMSRH